MLPLCLFLYTKLKIVRQLLRKFCGWQGNQKRQDPHTHIKLSELNPDRGHSAPLCYCTPSKALGQALAHIHLVYKVQATPA